MEKLKKLMEHRDAILLAEIGALIHDLGKLSEEFVKAHSIKEETSEWVYHTAWLNYEAEKGNDDARKLIKILKSVKVKLDKEGTSLYDFIVGHHEKKWGKTENYTKPEDYEYHFPDCSGKSLIKFILAADKFDSEEDRAGAKDQQSVYATFKSNSFGCDEEIRVDFKTERQEVYKKLIEVLGTCNIDTITKKRRMLLQALKDNFSKALGMTARSANDVTLWDHSYMTASIMKALFGQYLLCSIIINEENSQENSNVNKCKEFVDKVNKITSDFKKLIREYRPFQAFAIGWDFFVFIEQSHKIPDVVGRIQTIDEIKGEIKQIVEVDYALGNSIYEDDFGIYFLIPSILNEDALKEVKEKIFNIFNVITSGILLPVFHLEPSKQDDEFRIGKLLTEAIKNVKEKTNNHQIELITSPTWVKSWKDNGVETLKDKLVCNVCGKGFYYKGDDEKICETCKEIRSKGRKREVPQTVFIDEIAWNPSPNKKRYENVCLLVAKFDLDEWLNGKYIRSLFIKKPIEEQPIGQVYAGRTKNVLKSIVFHKHLDEKWGEDVENSIRRNLSYLPEDIRDILTGDLISELKKQAGDREIKYVMGSINKVVEDIFSRYDDLSIIVFIDKPSIDLQKPSSPSRLMRVWQDTSNFFELIAEKIKEKAPGVVACNIVLDEFTLEGKKLVEGLAYIIKIPKLGISGEVICEKGCESPSKLRVITPHLSEYLLNNVDEVRGVGVKIYHPEKKDLRVVATIRDVVSVKSDNSDSKESNKAYRVVSISPTLFMAIIPAKISLDIVGIMKEEYANNFGKVFGKLPLHVGLIYFKRKMPIFTVLDSVNRMLAEFDGEFKSDSDNYAKLRVVSEPANENGCRVLEVTPVEEYESFKYRVKIPYKLGDGNPDYYHPYLVVESNSNDTIELKVDGDTVLQKHVSKIRKEDVLKVRKSLFDFELLDSNIRRFDVGRERKHWLFTSSTSKPKPYLLWDIDNFERLRELIIEKLELTTTQIMNLYEMMMDKIEEWDLKDVEKLKKDATFEKFVNNAIRSIPLRLKVVDSGKSEKDRITREDYELLKATIMNGMFFDFVDLWHTVLKEKFEKKEGGEENV